MRPTPEETALAKRDANEAVKRLENDKLSQRGKEL